MYGFGNAEVAIQGFEDATNNVCVLGNSQHRLRHFVFPNHLDLSLGICFSIFDSKW
jgi:hypothetical protein